MILLRNFNKFANNITKKHIRTIYMNSTLNDDQELKNLVDQEIQRQKEGLELIASENFTTTAVMQVLGSVLTNKYSEGLPGKRYYGGNEIIDQKET